METPRLLQSYEQTEDIATRDTRSEDSQAVQDCPSTSHQEVLIRAANGSEMTTQGWETCDSLENMYLGTEGREVQS